MLPNIELGAIANGWTLKFEWWTVHCRTSQPPPRFLSTNQALLFRSVALHDISNMVCTAGAVFVYSAPNLFSWTIQFHFQGAVLMILLEEFMQRWSLHLMHKNLLQQRPKNITRNPAGIAWCHTLHWMLSSLGLRNVIHGGDNILFIPDLYPLLMNYTSSLQNLVRTWTWHWTVAALFALMRPFTSAVNGTLVARTICVSET